MPVRGVAGAGPVLTKPCFAIRHHLISLLDLNIINIPLRHHQTCREDIIFHDCYHAVPTLNRAPLIRSCSQYFIASMATPSTSPSA